MTDPQESNYLKDIPNYLKDSYKQENVDVLNLCV